MKHRLLLFSINNLHLSRFLCSIPETVAIMNERKKPKYDGRTKKRRWQDRRTDGETKATESTDSKIAKVETTDEPFVRIKKRKYAILMGYSGVDYYGMQRNPLTKTIEEDLFKALFDANFIDEISYNQIQNVQFQRAARTDKGVSAARQVVSMKLGENFEIEKINEKLCEQIRLFAFKRVTKGFNSKSQCDGRTYVYVTPTVVFTDIKDLPSPAQKGFRLPEETLTKINRVLEGYLGTRNYHNFTSKKKPNDPSAKRFIKSFVCEKPFVQDDVEFCVLKVHGQSFMMHQIRKMVGMVIAIVKGLTPEETLEKAFTGERINIPRAPGLGLMLDYVHYDRYNNRYGDDGVHEKLTWDEVENEVEAFKSKYILPTVLNTEIQEEAMVTWLNGKLSRHAYDGIEGKEESDDEEGGDDDEEDTENVAEENVEQDRLNSKT